VFVTFIFLVLTTNCLKKTLKYTIYVSNKTFVLPVKNVQFSMRYKKDKIYVFDERKSLITEVSF
jgi:hypothetical protein